MKLQDRHIGAAGVLVSVILFLNIKDASFQTKVFPIGLIMILLCLSLALIFRKGKNDGFEFPHFKKILIAFAMIALYMLGMQYIGFLVSTIAFVAAFLTVYHCKMNKIILIIFSIGYPVLIYVLFNHVLSVRLPAGLLI